MITDIEKSKKAVQDLIKQKYQPAQWEAEQVQKKKEIDEMLAFVEGVVAEFNRKKSEEEKDAELKKANILFKTDPLNPRGWSRTASKHTK